MNLYESINTNVNDPIRKAITEFTNSPYIPKEIHASVYPISAPIESHEIHDIIMDNPSSDITVGYSEPMSTQYVLNAIMKKEPVFKYPVLIVLKADSYHDTLYFSVSGEHTYTQLFR